MSLDSLFLRHEDIQSTKIICLIIYFSYSGIQYYISFSSTV